MFASKNSSCLTTFLRNCQALIRFRYCIYSNILINESYCLWRTRDEYACYSVCNPFILSQSCNPRVCPLSVCNGPFGMHQCVRVPCYKYNNYLAYDKSYLCRKRVTNVLFGFVSLNGSVDRNLSMICHKSDMLIYSGTWCCIAWCCIVLYALKNLQFIYLCLLQMIPLWALYQCVIHINIVAGSTLARSRAGQLATRP